METVERRTKGPVFLFAHLFPCAQSDTRTSYLSLSLFVLSPGKTMSAHIAMQVSGATTTVSGNGPSYDVW